MVDNPDESNDMIRTETDLARCRELWTKFSPNEDAWDDWDLMFAFHDEKRHQLHFLVHENGEPDGLIPLVYDTTQDRYMLMGGSYPDGRVLWLDTEDFPAFFDAFPQRTALFDLKQHYVDGLLQQHPQFSANCSDQDLRYFLKPPDFDYDFYRHIDSFDKDKRQKFLYDLRHIGKRNPVLSWSDDDEADLFIGLVNKNFGDESDYANDEDANEVRRVVDELKRSGRLRTLTIEVDGSKQAASLSLVHGSRMVALYAASNNDINNLGKLLNVETIQEGCRLRVDEISYMTGMKWKSQWQMKSEPVVTLRKPPGPWGDA